MRPVALHRIYLLHTARRMSAMGQQRSSLAAVERSASCAEPDAGGPKTDIAALRSAVAARVDVELETHNFRS